MANDIDVRIATPADVPLLRRLERESPLRGEHGVMQVDRGEDYLAQRRLMGKPIVLIGEVEGEPAGTFGAVRQPVMIDGREGALAYTHHARILPAYQRHGVGGVLARWLSQHFREADPPVDGELFYIDRHNAPSQRAARFRGAPWSQPVEWCQIDTAACAGAAVLESLTTAVTAAHAPRLCAIFNAAHCGEQLYLPYTPERLSERLGRDPTVYGWQRIHLGQGAAVGLWPHWVTVRSVPDQGPESEFRVGCVLDYGCLPGHEDELAAILRACARFLHERGTDRLSIFSSPPARLYELVRSLSADVEVMDPYTPGIPEPAASRYGVYVDHVFF